MSAELKRDFYRRVERDSLFYGNPPQYHRHVSPGEGEPLRSFDVWVSTCEDVGRRHGWGAALKGYCWIEAFLRPQFVSATLEDVLKWSGMAHTPANRKRAAAMARGWGYSLRDVDGVGRVELVPGALLTVGDALRWLETHRGRAGRPPAFVLADLALAGRLAYPDAEPLAPHPRAARRRTRAMARRALADYRAGRLAIREPAGGGIESVLVEK